jgi:hypothetical protein
VCREPIGGGRIEGTRAREAQRKIGIGSSGALELGELARGRLAAGDALEQRIVLLLIARMVPDAREDGVLGHDVSSTLSLRGEPAFSDTTFTRGSLEATSAASFRASLPRRLRHA